MKIRELVEYLDERFLPVYQEEYDNAGLLVGDPDDDLKGVLATTDVTPAVIDEAVQKDCNIIVSHHPLIFGGLKRITTHGETERMVMRLIRHNICVYAAHTNLDNLDWGVNGILAEKLRLVDCSILRPVEGALCKLVTYVPTVDADKLRKSLFEAGAGCIGNYDSCSWNCEGTGTFRANEGCNPYCGTVGSLHNETETRIEVVYEKRQEQRLVSRLKESHPYEEPAYDCIPLNNPYLKVGAGMIGRLDNPMLVADFLTMVKERLRLPVVRVSKNAVCMKEPTVRKVAVCGGSGSFLIGDAIGRHADIFLTGDLKYHDFQGAGERIILADIGHYESEQFAKEIFYRVISEKFSNFVCQISEADDGFVRYI